MATMSEFLSVLNSAKQQSVFWHNQTEVYSEHKTLNGFYDRIEGLLDSLVESYSGIFGRPKGYEAYDFVDWTSTDETIKYFQNLYQYVQTEREGLPKESWLQNIVDEIAAQISQTIYLLTLKK